MKVSFVNENGDNVYENCSSIFNNDTLNVLLQANELYINGSHKKINKIIPYIGLYENSKSTIISIDVEIKNI